MNAKESIVQEVLQKHQLETQFIADCLVKMKMMRSVEILKKEADLQDMNVEKMIQHINNKKTLCQNEQKQWIKTQLQKKFIRLILCNLQEAVQMFEKYLPKYFSSSELDQLALKFLQPIPQQTHSLQKSLCKHIFLSDRKKVQKHKITQISLPNGIWFISSNGTETVVIDKLSNAILLLNEQVVCVRQKIHEIAVNCIKWIDNERLCTCGSDKKLKLWSKDLQCLNTFAFHKQQIGCFIYDTQNIISGGNDPFLIKISLKDMKQMSKIMIEAVRDMLWLSNSKTILCLHVKDKTNSSFSFLNADCTIISKKEYPQIVYNMMADEKENRLFVNCADSTIGLLSLRDLTCLHKFSGFIQTASVMSMGVGGPKGKYLAVTSQSGEIIVFNISYGIPVIRIQSQLASASALLWQNKDSLLVGYDHCILEKWLIKIPQ